MTQLQPESVSEGRSEPSWMAHGAYLEHLQPSQPVDAPPCAHCLDAGTPEEGCEEGQRLWGAYRLTRIGQGGAL